MYEAEQKLAAHRNHAVLGGAIDTNPTVEENIDRRIAHLKAEVDRLEQSKVELAPLLKMRIRDVRNAMELY